MRTLRTIIGLACVLALPATIATAEAQAAVPGMPPDGKVMLGVGGGNQTIAQFSTTTRRRHLIYNVFLGWGQGYTWGKKFQYWIDLSTNGDTRLMVSVGTKKKDGSKISPRWVANGNGDGYLIQMSKQFNDSGLITYIRPPAEMNGHWSPWCAYNSNGTRRGLAYRQKQYIRAFRRMALIMRGGDVATINTKLNNAGLPDLNTGLATLPASGKVALVWNPQGEGSPNVTGNQPKNYYPGGAYVDYVANDLYYQGGAHWTAHNRLYNAYPGKPFMIVEWAPWGTDTPSFIDAMFKWVNSHKRTKALMYHNGSGDNTFRLSAKPRSLKRYRYWVNNYTRYRCPTCHATS